MSPMAKSTGGGSGRSSNFSGYSGSPDTSSRAPAPSARSSARSALSLAMSRSDDLGAASHACDADPNSSTSSLKRTAPTPGRSDSASAACRERSLGENGVRRLDLCRLPEIEQLAPERAEHLVEPQPSGGAQRIHAERFGRLDRRRLHLAEQIHLREHHAVRRLRELCRVAPDLCAQPVVLRLPVH